MFYKSKIYNALFLFLASCTSAYTMEKSLEKAKPNKNKQADTLELPRVFFSASINQVLHRLIAAEQKGIWGACYNFDSEELAQQWAKNKKDRSKISFHDVLVVDSGYKANKTELQINRQNQALSILRESGINIGRQGVRYDSSNGYERMHHKFFIFRRNLGGKQLLVTGSYNWTNSSKGNWENIVIIDDPNTISIFGHELKSLFLNSNFNKKTKPDQKNIYNLLNKSKHTKAQNISIPKAACSRDIHSVILNLINNEQEGIFGACFVFTLFDFAQLWLQKQILGKLVVDESYDKNYSKPLELLSNNGVCVHALKKLQDFELMHHKFFIFQKNVHDKPLVITGSFNWTGQARTNNWENIVILDDQNSINSFLSEFDWVFANSEPITNFESQDFTSIHSKKLNGQFIEPTLLSRPSFPFLEEEKKAEEKVKTIVFSDPPICPECDSDLKIIKTAPIPYAKCISSKCNYKMTANIKENSRVWCPRCQQNQLVVKKGIYGPFIGCRGFNSHNCKYLNKTY